MAEEKFVIVGSTPVAVRDMWTTPAWLVEDLREQHRFTVDAAATKETAVAPLYFGPDHKDPRRRDALSGTPWNIGGCTFINPPFSQGGGPLSRWIDACIEQSWFTKVVAVVPDTISCQWFHKAWENAQSVTLFDGRVRFDPPPGVSESSPRGGIVVFVFSQGTAMRGDRGPVVTLAKNKGKKAP